MFGGTWGTSDVVTITINGKVISTTTGTATIATFLATVVTNLNASVIPEFQEITWSQSTATLIGTADTPGKPFTMTVTKTSTSGTIDGTTSSAGTNTAYSSPNDISLAANWTGGVPIATNDIVFENSSVDVLYGLNQSAIAPNSLTIEPSFSGKFGNPTVTSTGYAEYRGTYLQYACATVTCAGTGGRIKLDLGSTAATITVNNTGSPIETGLEAMLIKGTALTALIVNKGSVAVGGLDTETGQALTTLTVGYVTSKSSDATVRLGAGVSAPTTINQFGGTLITNQACTTINKYGGTLTNKVGAVTTLKNLDGTVFYVSAGTCTTYTGGPTGTLDLSKDTSSRTFTNATIAKGSTIKDPSRTATWTNGVILQNCGVSDVSVNFGINVKLTPVAQ